MSPEQRRGGRVDYRSDIYALGIVLHELATGTHPFASSDVRAPLDLPGPHASPLEAIIARCLAQDPAERYQFTQDVVADLAAASARPSAGCGPRDSGGVGTGPWTRRAWPVRRAPGGGGSSTRV